MWKSLGSVQSLKPIKGYSLHFNSPVLLPECDVTSYFAEVVLHNINRACKELGRYGGNAQVTSKKTFPCYNLANDTLMLYPRPHQHLTAAQTIISLKDIFKQL